MKFDGWLFMTDMDGTILNENSEISDENAERLTILSKIEKCLQMSGTANGEAVTRMCD